MAKRNEICSKSVHDNGVKFEFADGTVLDFDITKAAAVRDKLAIHGASQKIGDSYAGAESVADAITSARDVIDGLYAGTWTTRTPGEPKLGLFVEALAAVKEWSIADAQKVVDALPDDKKKSYRNHPQIKLAMANIQLARAQKAAADAPALDL